MASSRPSSGQGPPRRPSGKGPASRAPSTAQTNVRTTSAKFYDGPTVAADVKDKARDVATSIYAPAAKTGAVAKQQAQRAVRKVRRHPWGFASLLTTIPFLLLLSLASTVFCPPPAKAHSPVSRFVLSSLGLHDPATEYGALRSTLCYPANVYHDTVLEPYVYPRLAAARASVTAHPLYTDRVLPAYAAAGEAANRVWEGPVKPIVGRVQRGARRFWLTFVDPHLPYLRAKLHGLTAPYAARASALQRQYVSPHIATASRYAKGASDSTAQGYRYVAGHPLTAQAGKYGRLAHRKGYEAYLASHPHLARAYDQTRRTVLEVILPRVLKGLEITSAQISKHSASASRQAQKVYAAHLEPVVGPYVARASAFTSPYTAAFNKHVYIPYIRPVLLAILPEAVVAPPPEKSFWAMIADMLPQAGSHVGEAKARMYDQAVKATPQVTDKIRSVTEKVKTQVSPSVSPTPSAKIGKAEIQAKADELKAKVDKAGKAGYDKLSSKLLDSRTAVVAEKIPPHATQATGQLERQIEHVIMGFNKFWSDPKKVSVDMVDRMSRDGESKVAAELRKIKTAMEKRKAGLKQSDEELVRAADAGVDAALSPEFDDLMVKMTALEGSTTKDWAKLNSVKSAAEGWKDKYHALPGAKSPLKALNSKSASIDQAFQSIYTDLDDTFEGYKARVGIMRRSVLDHIEAAEELSSTQTPSASTTGNGRYSILPVVEAAGVAAAADGIIGKGKEQVMDALSQASAAAAGATSTGVVEHAQSVGSSVIDEASSSLHSATRSVMRAVGATPSPEGVSEHVESVYSAASDQAQSAVSAASEAVHQATRSIVSAAGGTPSPEGAQEHLASIANVVAQGAASVYGVVEDNVHDATRSVISAAGGTPTPESAQEYVDSLLGDAASLASDASTIVHSATRAGMRAVGVTPLPESPGEYAESIADAASSSASSLASVASASLHSATRAGLRAVGATPTPETPGEYFESISDAASSVVSDASASVSSFASDASASVSSVAYEASSIATSMYSEVSSSASSAYSVASDQAAALYTSIESALGLAPSPTPLASSASAYLSSLASAGSTAGVDLLASGSSLLSSLQSEASASLHSATRAAHRAVGGTPTPESPREHLESVKAKVEDVARSVRDAVRDEL